MKVKELKEKECLQILRKSRFGRLACALDNQPYIVPFSFAYQDGTFIYAFATVGQKIEWMRKNPLVCIEVEQIKEKTNWTTLVIFGRYEELTETPEFEDERLHARELLARSPTWWQPAYFVGENRTEFEEIPVFFRVSIEKITGHRAYPENFEAFLPLGQPAVLKKKQIRGLW